MIPLFLFLLLIAAAAAAATKTDSTSPASQNWFPFDEDLITQNTPQFFQSSPAAQLFISSHLDLDTILNDSNMMHGVGKDFSLLRRVQKEGKFHTGYPPDFPLPSRTNSESARILFAQGFTLLINKLQLRKVPLISAMARALSHVTDDIDHVSANLYFSPGGNKVGFEAHFDWMDVVVVQVEGTKHWKVYDQLSSFPKHPFSPVQKRQPTEAELKTNFTNYVLNPGDVLFLPRGFIHEASTVDVPSMHITFGLERNRLGTVHGLIQSIIDSSRSDLSFLMEALIELTNSNEDGEMMRANLNTATFQTFQFTMMRLHMSLARGPNFEAHEVLLTQFLDSNNNGEAFLRHLANAKATIRARLDVEPTQKREL